MFKPIPLEHSILLQLWPAQIEPTIMHMVYNKLKFICFKGPIDRTGDIPRDAGDSINVNRNGNQVVIDSESDGFTATYTLNDPSVELVPFVNLILT